MTYARGRLVTVLTQVNSSPSLGTDSAFDEATKVQLITDTIRLVDPVSFNHDALTAVLVSRVSQEESSNGHPKSTFRPRASASTHPSPLPVPTATSSEAERERLEADLGSVLEGCLPRAVGEMPAYLGSYERICPGSLPFLRAMNQKFAHFRSVRGSSVAAPSAAEAPAGVPARPPPSSRSQHVPQINSAHSKGSPMTVDAQPSSGSGRPPLSGSSRRATSVSTKSTANG